MEREVMRKRCRECDRDRESETERVCDRKKRELDLEG